MPQSLKAIALTGEVEITAAAADGDKPAGPARFDVTAYTGGPMTVEGYDDPVVVDLSGLNFGKSLIANLDHDRTQRVGHVTDKSKDGGKLRLGGFASAMTSARDQVVGSARDGFTWQASIEATPTKIVELAAGKVVDVNGKKVTGPAAIIKKSVLKGFAFVSHGADDNTTVSIAASEKRGQNMAKTKDFNAWVESIGFDPENLTDDQRAGLEANYNGRPTPPRAPRELGDVFAEGRAERERRMGIANLAAEMIADRPDDVEAIEALAEKAIEAKWDADRFELETHRMSRPQAHTVHRRSSFNGLTNEVIQAAICTSGGLKNVEKKFKEPTLEAAHKLFPNGIGLKQLWLLCAQANGYHGSLGGELTVEVQRAAFGLTGDPRRPAVQASGFSTISIPGILSNVANKFIYEGWMSVDQAWRLIAAMRPVRDFKEVTTYSLIGGLQYEKVGPTGEIKHGNLGEVSYGNKADTYALMLGISRADLINDDAGALTVVPKRLGRGAALKMNDIFWTEFLDNASFFHSDYSNVSTGAGSALGTADGAAINAAEQKFLTQTDHDGKPLGVMPAIMLVPPTLKNTGARWMGSQLMVGSTGLGDANVYQGRFRLVSSPYMENASYTGYSAAAWYLLADPADLPVIEVCLLNGRDAPTVETAEADFNVLGVQMRGYTDAGVRKQEKKAGVRSAGS